MPLNSDQRKRIADLAFELIKLTFGGLVIGPFLKPELFRWSLIGIGAIMGLSLFVMMMRFSSNQSKEDRNGT